MQAANEVLEEEFKRLGKADELPSVHSERSDCLIAVVHEATRVVFWVAGDWWWRWRWVKGDSGGRCGRVVEADGSGCGW